MICIAIAVLLILLTIYIMEEFRINYARSLRPSRAVYGGVGKSKAENPKVENPKAEKSKAEGSKAMAPPVDESIIEFRAWATTVLERIANKTLDPTLHKYMIDGRTASNYELLARGFDAVGLRRITPDMPSDISSYISFNAANYRAKA